ncbi:MAG: hypothetical protein L0K69_11720 [Enterobacterales bacterium]|nr:hypothetical protein [Enterobacterales bacterium]
MNNLPIETYESVVQQRDALEKKLADVVAEAESIKSRMQLLVDIVDNADNSYCMCGSAMKDHGIYGCGSPTGMFDYHYGKWIESEDETPATDAFTRELMAKGVDALADHLSGMNISASETSVREFADQLRKGINDAQ